MPRKQPFTPDDIYLLKQVLDPQLSPDGTRVANTVLWPDREDDENRMAVYIASLDGKEPARRFSHGKRDHSPRWSPDGKYLAFVSDRGEKSQVFLAPLDGGEARQLTHAKWGISQPAWSPDGKQIAYAARTGDYKEPKERKGIEKNAPRIIRDLRYKMDGIGFYDSRRLHIFVCDVESGEERQVTDGDFFDDQPSWSPDGRTIAFVSDRERARNRRHWRADVWSVPAKGGRARKLTPSRGGAAHPTYSRDGKWIAYAGHENGDEGSAKNTHLMIVPAKGGVPRSISEALDRPAAGWPAFASGRSFCWSRDSRSVYFLAGDRGRQSLYKANLSGRFTKALDGERQIEAFALSADQSTIVFTAVWPSAPWELYAASLKNGKKELNLSHANDEIVRTRELADVQRLAYKGRDGMPMEAFVLYPEAYRKGRKYPIAINVHGGPHSYHPGAVSMLEYHSFASKGYVVVLPNPRGSITYGEAFSEACVRDWGGEDWYDILGAVDTLIKDGVADKKRLYIGGFSYGGFMSAWAVGQTDRFRAAWVGAPVADHVSMFGTSDIPLFDMHEIGGLPQDHMQTYIERSPITYLRKASTPVLLLHHEGDLRCPIAQSEEIFQAMKAMGKTVEFVRYPGGFHRYMTHAPSQTADRIRRQIAWFERFAPRRAKAARTPVKQAKGKVLAKAGS
jgi:dipeptidyl aminopeptidase/acylaminoacyl peptidase